VERAKLKWGCTDPFDPFVTRKGKMSTMIMPFVEKCEYHPVIIRKYQKNNGEITFWNE